MNEILKKLWNRQLDFDERNEKERNATKELSREYDELFNKLANTLSSDQLEIFELLLEKEGEIEAVSDEMKFIRYTEFGARLLNELNGDISEIGNIPYFSDAGEDEVIRGLYNNDFTISERIIFNNKEFKHIFQKSEAISEKLMNAVSPEVWIQIEELIDAIHTCSSIHEADVFSYAFKTGAQAMLEIMKFRR